MYIQTQDAHRPKFNGIVQCTKLIMEKESVRGLYRGMSSPLAGVAAINATVFGVYGSVQRHATNPNSYATHFVAGSVAGLTQSLICSPVELAKTRLQLQSNVAGAQMFKGPVQLLSYIYRSDGVRGLFKGVTVTAMRDIPGYAIYFVSYEFLTRLKPDPGLIYTSFAGGMAGIFSWLFSFPIDVIKSRFQADGMSNGRRTYNGLIDCARKSYEAEGRKVFFRGCSATLLRAFPMNAVCFVVVANTLKYFDRNNEPLSSEDPKLSNDYQLL